MFCKNCGKKIPDDSIFCEHCGTKVEKEELVKETHNGLNDIKKIKGKQLNKKTLIAGAFGVIAIIGVLVFILTRPNKIQLTDLVHKHVADGINGAGYIEVDDVIEPNELSMILSEEDNGIADVTEDNFDDFLLTESERWDEIDKIVASIHYSLSVNGKEVKELYGLTNGDKIKVEVYSDNPVSKYFNIKFVKGSVEFEVEGLTDGKMINPFDEQYFELSFEGANGEAKAKPRLSLEYGLDRTINYIEVVDERNTYKNGDQVTICIDYDIREMASFGYALSETTKTFTVEGLGEKVTRDNVSSINETSLRKYVDYALVACQNRCNEEFTYYETYLLLDKTVYNKPSLLVVFAYESVGEEKYMYYEFSDLTINENGDLSSSNYNESKKQYGSFVTFGLDDVLNEDFYDYSVVEFNY